MTTAVPPSQTSPEYKIVIESATISSVPAAGLSGLCHRWAEGNPTVLSGSPARPEGMSDWPFAGSAPACFAFRATRPATSLRNSALKSGGTSEAVCVAVARGSALPTNRLSHAPFEETVDQVIGHAARDRVRGNRRPVHEAPAFDPVLDQAAPLHFPEHGGDGGVSEAAFTGDGLVDLGYGGVAALPEEFHDLQLKIAQAMDF